jgi:deoxyribose-phosphate aldolase
VKTSTATQPGGATVEDIRLMRATLSPQVVVKASAYVTDIDKTMALYDAGARRFGTGYTEAILDGLKKRLAARGRKV